MSHDAEKLNLRIGMVVAIILAVASAAFCAGTLKNQNDEHWRTQLALNEQLQASIKENRSLIDSLASGEQKAQTAIQDVKTFLLALVNKSPDLPALKTGLGDHETRPEQGN